jgi:hypothetical protein
MPAMTEASPNPDAALRRFLSRTRLLQIAVLVMFMFALTLRFSDFVRSRNALITADPYAYLLFAQELAEGHLHFSGVLAETIAEFAENEEMVRGPIWNTNVLPGGKTVFTVAIGYPLVLALALKIGGIWLYTHINIFLMGLVLGLLLWVCWEGWGRSQASLITGMTACLLFLHSHAPTFIQFSNPWREPLSYICVLGGVYGALRFFAGGRLLFLAAAGLCLGYAGAVKEANAIYGLCLGVYLLCSPSWRQHPQKFRALLLFGLCGIAGVSPLLLQNLSVMGNPLLSLQFGRAMSHYSLVEPGHGVSTGNLGNTLIRYFIIYREYWMFWIPCLLLGAYGLIRSWRRPAGKMLFWLVVVHLALYLQWGNADFRHSFFLHLPFAVFFAAGLTDVIQRLSGRIRMLEPYAAWCVAVPLFVIALWPSPWAHQLGERQRELRFREAAGIAEAVCRQTGDEAVILSNRKLRDVLGVYGGISSVRLHDLAWFHPRGEVRPVLERLLFSGTEVYFLDNKDQDPKNAGRIDWSKQDGELVRDSFDLVPAFTLESPAVRVELFHDEPVVTGFRVKSWSATRVVRELTIPPEGAAFLYVNPRAAGAGLDVKLNERPLPVDPVRGFFVPVHGAGLVEMARFDASFNGQPMPALNDLRLVGWHETIRQPFGEDSAPRDTAFFPDGIGDPHEVSFRSFQHRVRIRLPVRQTPELFTTIGFGVKVVSGFTNVQVYMQIDDRAPAPMKVAGSAAYFPCIANAELPFAGTMDVWVFSDTPAQLSFSRVKSHSSLSRLEHTPGEGILGVGLKGLLTPMRAGVGPHPWSAVGSDGFSMEGRCFDDPRQELNRFKMWLPTGDDRGGRRHVEFSGAGLIQHEWVAVGERLVIRPGDPADVFLSAHYPPEGMGEERFCWTKATASVAVPVTSGSASYRLSLDAAGRAPDGMRVLRVRFEGRERTMDLPRKRGGVELEFSSPAETTAGLAPLALEIEPWVPKRSMRSPDDRELGFQLYGLTWEPVVPSP